MALFVNKIFQQTKASSSIVKTLSFNPYVYIKVITYSVPHSNYIFNNAGILKASPIDYTKRSSINF